MAQIARPGGGRQLRMSLDRGQLGVGSGRKIGLKPMLDHRRVGCRYQVKVASMRAVIAMIPVIAVVVVIAMIVVIAVIGSVALIRIHACRAALPGQEQGYHSSRGKAL